MREAAVFHSKHLETTVEPPDRYPLDGLKYGPDVSKEVEA